jgi:hypothetical protein
MPETEKSLRDHLLFVLRGGGAHISFDDFITDFPPELCDRQVSGLPYTAWQVLEHMRLAQWDILEFSRNPNHVSPEFPRGYWPAPNERGTPELWNESIEKFRSDLNEMDSLVANNSIDLYATIPHGSGQTILREVLLVADHNAYHLGALAVMARMLKNNQSGKRGGS